MFLDGESWQNWPRMIDAMLIEDEMDELRPEIISHALAEGLSFKAAANRVQRVRRREHWYSKMETRRMDDFVAYANERAFEEAKATIDKPAALAAARAFEANAKPVDALTPDWLLVWLELARWAPRAIEAWATGEPLPAPPESAGSISEYAAMAAAWLSMFTQPAKNVPIPLVELALSRISDETKEEEVQ